MKIAVFDNGWGGELFADFLEQEMGAYEIVRVIDWRSQVDMKSSIDEVRAGTERALRRVIYKVDLIVIASFTVTAMTMAYLQRKYKRQRFVGFVPDLAKKVRRIKGQERAVVLAPKIVRRTKAYEQEIEELQAKKVEVVEVEEIDDWVKRIDEGELTARDVLRRFCKVETDNVLLYETQFSDLKGYFEQFYGWRVNVFDQFEDMTKQIARILERI